MSKCTVIQETLFAMNINVQFVCFDCAVSSIYVTIRYGIHPGSCVDAFNNKMFDSSYFVYLQLIVCNSGSLPCNTACSAWKIIKTIQWQRQLALTMNLKRSFPLDSKTCMTLQIIKGISMWQTVHKVPLFVFYLPPMVPQTFQHTSQID